MIVLSWTELETSLSAVTRIRQFTATPAEGQEGELADAPEDWPMHGAISFENFSASYTDGGAPVLKDINLDIAPGEKVGICGRTGSGKSSLLSTLFGLLHQTTGTLTIDDIPTTAIPLALLRSSIIAMPQDPFFLHGTVRHNLAPWTSPADTPRPPVPDANMQAALQQVQLWDKLSAAAALGQSALDASLDHVESLLSQGERQLFCLARAVLMGARIVVLDEATSSVDAHTDALMQRVLREAFADRTIIAVAHRLDMILDFDRVVVMDKGRIVEVGPPGVLVRKEGADRKSVV